MGADRTHSLPSRKLLFRLGLFQADNPVAGFPLAALAQELDPLKTGENISLFEAGSASDLKTAVL